MKDKNFPIKSDRLSHFCNLADIKLKKSLRSTALKGSINNFFKHVIPVKTMALIEKVFYKLGGAIADVVLFSAKPVASVTAIGCVTKYGGTAVKKFSKFAAKVALKDKTQESISENLFKCLDYLI